MYESDFHVGCFVSQPEFLPVRVTEGSNSVRLIWRTKSDVRSGNWIVVLSCTQGETGGGACRHRVKVRTLDDLFRSSSGLAHVNVLRSFERFVASLRYRAGPRSAKALVSYAGGDRFESRPAMLTEVFCGFS
jgi:hypothetical protein